MLVMLKMEHQAEHLLGSQSQTREFCIVPEHLACLFQQNEIYMTHVPNFRTGVVLMDNSPNMIFNLERNGGCYKPNLKTLQ